MCCYCIKWWGPWSSWLHDARLISDLGRVGVKVADFCQVTDNTYTREEVLEMERILLDTLNWELTQPTIVTFLRRFVKAATFHEDPAVSKRYPPLLPVISIEFIWAVVLLSGRNLWIICSRKLSIYNKGEVMGACQDHSGWLL